MKTKKTVSKKVGKSNKSKTNGNGASNGNRSKIADQVWTTQKQVEEVKKEVVIEPTPGSMQAVLDFLKVLTSEVAELKKAQLTKPEEIKVEVAEVKTAKSTKKEKKAEVTKVEATIIEIPETLNRDTAVELLIKLREAKKVRPADIAKFVGIKSSSVACWLNGVSSPSRKHMPKVAELIGQFAN